MQKYADYIKRIEIDSLWSGQHHIVWSLDRQVNILSGVNGVGKSTIINKVVKSVSTNGDIVNHLLKGVHLPLMSGKGCYAYPLLPQTLVPNGSGQQAQIATLGGEDGGEAHMLNGKAQLSEHL